ncbi:hypothetical protein R1sor_018470 [Riccia sorocarpa]|uniref:Uncharacterized protein n=1 Tax=Riccia sorocarpa TaxID=122646 RepID=A0ABD3I9S8_9MARC
MSYRMWFTVLRADLHYERGGEQYGVGLRVRVWWPLDQKFYHGQIVRYDPTLGIHKIMYDDGEEEFILMSKERWEVEMTLPTNGTTKRLSRRTERSCE